MRRIEALTGAEADAYVSAHAAILASSAGLFKSAPEDVPQRISQLLDERRRLDRELTETRRKLALAGDGAGEGGGAQSAQEGKEIAGAKFVTRLLDGIPAKDLKPMVDEFKARESGVYAVISASADGKASIVIGVTDDLTGRFDAVALVRAGAAALGGKGGGGRPDMAQAGGPDAGAADAAFKAIAKAMEDAAG